MLAALDGDSLQYRAAELSSELAALDQQVQEELAEAIRFADESPIPTVDAVVQDVYSDIVEEVRAR